MHSAQLSFLYETSATHVVTDPKQQQSARPVHVADATRCVIDRAGQLLHWQQPGQGRQAVTGHQPIWTAGGVHGLSAQIGALRPVLTATALAVCSRC